MQPHIAGVTGLPSNALKIGLTKSDLPDRFVMIECAVESLHLHVGRIRACHPMGGFLEKSRQNLANKLWKCAFKPIS